VPFDRGRIHLEPALDAIDPSREVGEHLPDDLQIAVRRIHLESYALSTKPVSRARNFSGLVYFTSIAFRD
jgi:hypothetical protein